jgi:predicted dehydrogenase
MKDKINVAVVGCGGFARGVHLPNMAGSKKYSLLAACDMIEEAAEEVKNEYHMGYATTEYQKVLDDPEVDLVVITTRHNLHAEQSVKAAQARKHILCEKPMGMNYHECKKAAEAVKRNGVKYAIGYNRGLAPHVRKAGELLSNRKSPVIMYHRMANPVPADHWLLNEEMGGGRFIGEGCHIFDLFCAVIQSAPTQLYADGGIFTNPGVVKTPDTGSVIIGFEDGSVATLLLSSVGHESIPKESTEIYCGDSAILIEDFQGMKIRGFSEEGDIVLNGVDKGHKIELDLLADAILGDSEIPNGLKAALKAALLSFKSVESIRTHEVQKISKEEYRI